MSLLDSSAADDVLTSVDDAVEECVDYFNDLVLALHEYPPAVLATALRIHLASLLRTLLEQGECTHAQAAAFVAQLEREVLPSSDESGGNPAL